MKLKSYCSILAMALLFSAGTAPADQITTAFSYNGYLTSEGSPETGAFDFEFTLFGAPTGGGPVAGPVAGEDIQVNNGVFTTSLDFGDVYFDGQRRWLQIAVRPGDSSGPFTLQLPRQELTATPFAHYAKAAQIAASIAPGGVNGPAIAPDSVKSEAIENGTIETGDMSFQVLNNTWWRLDGNAGTSGGAFVGTIDKQALDFKAYNERVMRLEANRDLEPDLLGAPNIIAGSYANAVDPGVVAGTISGGGMAYNAFLGAVSNRVTGSAGTIGGGFGNVASYWAVVTGGARNTSSGTGSTVAGGVNNQSIRDGATVGGGANNICSSPYATIPGGAGNRASGNYSFAAGCQASASHLGTFVWADFASTTSEYFESTGPNQFAIRARGGLRLNGDTSQFFGSTTRQMLNLWTTDYGIGVQADTLYQRSNWRFSWYRGGTHAEAQNDPGGGAVMMTLEPGGLTVNGTLVSSSDRNLKENFSPINAREILEKVVSLPLAEWQYKDAPTTRHLGPMAQDFYAAFQIGPDEKHIATVDADGVALAAIQGLNKKVEQQQAQLRLREQEIRTLTQSVSELKTLMAQLLREQIK